MSDISKDYTTIPNSLVLEARLSPNEFRVLVYLAMWTTPRPSKWQIIDATGISSIKVVDEALKELKRLGVITWKRGSSKGPSGTPNSYQILPFDEWKLAERNDWRGRGTRLKRKARQAITRYLLNKGRKSDVMLRPGEERPEEDDDRKW